MPKSNARKCGPDGLRTTPVLPDFRIDKVRRSHPAQVSQQVLGDRPRMPIDRFLPVAPPTWGVNTTFGSESSG